MTLQPDVIRTGALVNTGDLVALDVHQQSAWAVQLTGTWTGTVTFEASLDGATFVPVAMTPLGGGATTTTATANGAWRGDAAALNTIRVRASAAMTGTVNVTLVGTLYGSPGV